MLLNAPMQFPDLSYSPMKLAERVDVVTFDAYDFSGILVEVQGFEPWAFWSRTKRATKLRYTSLEPIKGLEPLTCGLRNRCSTN